MVTPPVSLDFVCNSRKEGRQFNWVEAVVSADAAAQIQTKWLDNSDGLGDVGRIKTTCKKERNADGVADTTA